MIKNDKSRVLVSALIVSGMIAIPSVVNAADYAPEPDGLPTITNPTEPSQPTEEPTGGDVDPTEPQEPDGGQDTLPPEDGDDKITPEELQEDLENVDDFAIVADDVKTDSDIEGNIAANNANINNTAIGKIGNVTVDDEKDHLNYIENVENPGHEISTPGTELLIGEQHKIDKTYDNGNATTIDDKKIGMNHNVDVNHITDETKMDIEGELDKLAETSTELAELESNTEVKLKEGTTNNFEIVIQENVDDFTVIELLYDQLQNGGLYVVQVDGNKNTIINVNTGDQTVIDVTSEFKFDDINDDKGASGGSWDPIAHGILWNFYTVNEEGELVAFDGTLKTGKINMGTVLAPEAEVLVNGNPVNGSIFADTLLGNSNEIHKMDFVVRGVDEEDEDDDDDIDGPVDDNEDPDDQDPVNPDEPTDPVDPEDPDEPTDPEDPTDPEPQEPTDPVDPEDPDEPEPTEPVDPEDPVDPEPVDPEDPDEPEPTEPVDPEDPVDPEPAEPVDPEPVDPEDPVDPEPTEPVDPEPQEPTDPDEPIDDPTPIFPDPDQPMPQPEDPEPPQLPELPDCPGIKEPEIPEVVIPEPQKPVVPQQPEPQVPQHPDVPKTGDVIGQYIMTGLMSVLGLFGINKKKRR